MLGTFGFVLILTMIKDAFEDYQRYKSDRTANNRECETWDYDNKEWVISKWKDV